VPGQLQVIANHQPVLIIILVIVVQKLDVIGMEVIAIGKDAGIIIMKLYAMPQQDVSGNQLIGAAGAMNIPAQNLSFQ